MPNSTGYALACQLDKRLPADVDYMALRREEDAAACDLIGATPIWLPFPEAPHRGYHSVDALFTGVQRDDDIIDRVKPALSQLVEMEAPDVVFAPQAVGAHVDHVAVYRALSDCTLAVRLWNDFPYAIRHTSRPSPFAAEVAMCHHATITLDEREMRAKRSAVSGYASQLAFQFGSADLTETIGDAETFASKACFV